MLTSNFYSYIRACMHKTSANFTLTDGSAKSNNMTQLKDAVGPFQGMHTFTQNAKSFGTMLGTGTTPPKVTDYCLEKPITSGLSATYQNATTYVRMDDYEEYTAVFGVTATNTVTITEIGLICYSYQYSSDKYAIMVDRTLLENPIEIPAGETRQITYTIRFNYPKV